MVRIMKKHSIDKTLKILAIKKINDLKYASAMCNRLLQHKSLGFEYTLFYDKVSGLHKNDRALHFNNVIDEYLGDIRDLLEQRMKEIQKQEATLLRIFTIKKRKKISKST